MKLKHTLLALAVMTGAANAALYVNFGGGNGKNQAVGGGNAAGINGATTWTDVTAANDAVGITGAGGRAVTWASNNTWGGTATGGTLSGSDALMNTWLDDGNTLNVTLSGLTAGDTITIYGSSDFGNAGRSLGWQIDGVDTLADGGALFADPLNANGDYFDGYGSGNPDSYTFVATQATHVITRHSGATGTTRSAVAGIEVTAVPEPSSTALLGLGGLALIMRRRK